MAVLVSALTACASTEEQTTSFVEHGIKLEIPPAWNVSGFSETVFPRRLVAASYEVARADVEGDCGGLEAVRRLPRDGAYVVLIDYGQNLDRDQLNKNEFSDRLPLTLRDGRLAEYECFGHSYLFRFLVRDRALQAHVGLGRAVDTDLRAEALAVLNSMEVKSR